MLGGMAEWLANQAPRLRINPIGANLGEAAMPLLSFVTYK